MSGEHVIVGNVVGNDDDSNQPAVLPIPRSSRKHMSTSDKVGFLLRHVEAMQPRLTENGPVALLPGDQGRYEKISGVAFKVHARAFLDAQVGASLDRDTWQDFQEQVAAVSSSWPHAPMFVRCGSMDGCDRWIDMVGEQGSKFICFNGGGWSLEDSCEIPFARGDGMAPLPEPVRGGSLRDFERYANFSSEDWLLVWAWIGYCLRGETWEHAKSTDPADGPFLPLVITGQRHSGKTTATKFIASLVDPSLSGALAPLPKRRDALAAHVNGRFLLVSDNESSLGRESSDTLCRLCVGERFIERRMYFQGLTFTVVAKRPVITNSISNLVNRTDLASRCLILELQPIPFKSASDVIPRDIKEKSGQMFGALLDVMYRAEQLLATGIECSVDARGAGFNLYGEAFSQAMGHAPGIFTAAREGRALKAEEEAIADNPIREMIDKLMEGRDTWQGTSAMFLQQSREKLSEAFFRTPGAPLGATKVTRDLNDIKPSLAREYLIETNVDLRGPLGSSAKRGLVITRVTSGPKPISATPLDHPYARTMTQEEIPC